MSLCTRAKYDKAKVEKIHKVALELEEINKIKEFKDNLKRRQTWTKTHTFADLPFKSCPSIPRIDSMTNSVGKETKNSLPNFNSSRRHTIVSQTPFLAFQVNTKQESIEPDSSMMEEDYEDDEEEIYEISRNKKRVNLNTNSLLFYSENNIHNWLKSRGKDAGLGREKIRELKELFSALDEDGSAAIGVDELESPLITLGLVNNRQEIKEIVQEVDKDGTGEIELEEFLKIFTKRNGKEANTESRIKDFFNSLDSGDYK